MESAYVVAGDPVLNVPASAGTFRPGLDADFGLDHRIDCETEPPLTGWKTADIPASFRPGIGTVNSRQIRPGTAAAPAPASREAAALAAGDPGDTVHAHQPDHATAPDLNALSSQFAGNALGPIGRVGGMDLDDQLGELLLVVFAPFPVRLGANPGVEVAPPLGDAASTRRVGGRSRPRALGDHDRVDGA